jgi:peptide/nickel transport system substrate-binding protein
LSPTVNGFADVGGWQFNPDRAGKLLAEAGWKAGSGGVLEKSGKPLKLKLLTSIGRYPKEREVAEVVQSQLSAVGIKVEIVAQEWVAHLASGFKGDYDVFMYGWGVATGDADYGLYTIFHSSLMPPVSPKGNNFSKLKDQSLDRLLEAAKVERDDKKRNDLYRRAQLRLKELEPLVILYHFYETVASKRYVEGLAPHPGEHLRVENAVMKK